MNQSGLQPKGTPERWVQEARQAWARRDIARCVDRLERASKAAPDDTSILLHLGGILGGQYQYDAARKAFDKAIDVASPENKLATLTAAARCAQSFLKTDLAEHYFDQALNTGEPTQDALVWKAGLLERQQQWDEALALLHEALTKDDGCQPALLAQARVLSQKGELKEAEAQLRHLLDHTDQIETRIYAGSQLGGVLDRQARYDEAMATVLQTADLLRPMLANQAQARHALRQRLAQMRTQLSKNTLDQWFALGRTLDPPRRFAVLAGHPHSSLPPLEQALTDHPDVVAMEENTHFTDHVLTPLHTRSHTPQPLLQMLNDLPKERIQGYRDRYFRAADGWLGSPVANRLLIDNTPSLSLWAPAVARVFPETKFLVAIRDPRDVVLNCFMHPVRSVERAAYPYTDLKTTVESYSTVMRTWQTVAPLLPNPSLQVRYEDLADNAQATINTTLDFLGVPHSPTAPTDPNPGEDTRSTRTETLPNASTHPPGWWRHYAKHLEPHIEELKPFLEAFGYE